MGVGNRPVEIRQAPDRGFAGQNLPDDGDDDLSAVALGEPHCGAAGVGTQILAELGPDARYGGAQFEDAGVVFQIALARV